MTENGFRVDNVNSPLFKALPHSPMAERRLSYEQEESRALVRPGDRELSESRSSAIARAVNKAIPAGSSSRALTRSGSNYLVTAGNKSLVNAGDKALGKVEEPSPKE